MHDSRWHQYWLLIHVKTGESFLADHMRQLDICEHLQEACADGYGNQYKIPDKVLVLHQTTFEFMRDELDIPVLGE